MWDWLNTAQEFARLGQPFAMVTIISIKGSTPRGPGAKLLVLPDGRFFGTIGGGQLEKLVLEDAQRALDQAVNEPRSYPLCFRTGQCCGGAVETFIEIFGVGPVLHLFGAGHVGQSLSQTLVGTPFTVHVVDQRAEWLQSPELPSGVIRHQQDWRQYIEEALWDRQRTYVLVMSHDHQLDLDIIREVITRPARFIGLIGSETKSRRFQQRLKDLGASADEINRVHCPIGVGSFGKAPREVAISAAAQLLQLHHG